MYIYNIYIEMPFALLVALNRIILCVCVHVCACFCLSVPVRTHVCVCKCVCVCLLYKIQLNSS